MTTFPEMERLRIFETALYAQKDEIIAGGLGGFIYRPPAKADANAKVQDARIGSQLRVRLPKDFTVTADPVIGIDPARPGSDKTVVMVETPLFVYDPSRDERCRATQSDIDAMQSTILQQRDRICQLQTELEHAKLSAMTEPLKVEARMRGPTEFLVCITDSDQSDIDRLWETVKAACQP